MSRIRLVLLAVIAAVLFVLPVVSQPPKADPKPKTPPRLVPVAETKLIMEGINQANFQGLEKLLKNKELDAEGWNFARGQALLIAESGNLLMLRPPKNSGQDAWMKAAMELRETASSFARSLTTRDLEKGRAGLAQLAKTCNSCHQTFNVKARITAFEPATP
jgi:hypothetical protein